MKGFLSAYEKALERIGLINECFMNAQIMVDKGEVKNHAN
jgi:hypothetical protein